MWLLRYCSLNKYKNSFTTLFPDRFRILNIIELCKFHVHLLNLSFQREKNKVFLVLGGSERKSCDPLLHQWTNPHTPQKIIMFAHNSTGVAQFASKTSVKFKKAICWLIRLKTKHINEIYKYIFLCALESINFTRI